MPRKTTKPTSKKVSKQMKQDVEANSNPTPVKERVVIVNTVTNKRESSEVSPMPHDLFQYAANLVSSEKTKYEMNSMGLRKTLQRAYKNYLMVYDQPYDPYTKRKKIFTPLTHNIVDAVSKPIKVTGKAIKVTPITNTSKGASKILNMVLPYFFQQMGFESIMKDVAHRTAWMGKVVTVQDWYYEENEIDDENEATTQIKLGFAFKEKTTGKVKQIITDRPRIRLINLLDLYIDVTAESIPWAIRNSSVILRSLIPLADIQANPLYDDEVKANLNGSTIEASDNYGVQGTNKYAGAGFQSGEVKSTNYSESEKGNVPFVELFERYGMIPKSWITGKPEDELINVPGIITAVTSEKGEVMQTLNIRMSPFGTYGPFEECNFNHLPNRWYGEGLGELLVPLQTAHNEIVNIRRNNELIIQNRMYLYRKGKVDPSQFFSRPGGGIAVQDMGDVQPMPTPDIAPSSFAEDQYILQQAQAIAGIALTPSSKKMTASETNNIQANANMTYSELQGRMEEYLEKLLLNHLIPLLRKFFTEKKTIPIELPVKEMNMLDTYNGYEPFQTDLLGDTRFLFIDSPKVFDGDFLVSVDIDGGETTRMSQVQGLDAAMAMASKIQNSGLNMQMAFRKRLELVGIVDDRLFEDQQPLIPTGITAPPQAPQMPAMPNIPQGAAPMV